MKTIIFLVLLLFGGSVTCQLLPFQDEDNIITPSFNLDIIRSKNISSLTLHTFVKANGLPIKDEGKINIFYFDTTGKLTQSMNMNEKGDKWDSVCTLYYYDKKSNLTVKRTDMKDYFDTWYYTWNNSGQMIREAHVHEVPVSPIDADFKIATQRIISCDSLAYILYPKQLQQFAYNEDNKIFRKTIFQYDDKKRFISRNTHYTVGWLYSEVDLNYDSIGRIAQYAVTGNINGDRNNTTNIKYDSIGNLNHEDILVDGKQKHKIEFMYNPNTGLISHKLDMETDNEIINITNFDYEMYKNK